MTVKTIPPIGLIGLGVMGRNLALNLRDKGAEVTAWDPWPEARQWQADGIASVSDIATLVQRLPTPRNILLMVKADDPVDDMIGQLMPRLSAGDCIIDGGNSHFSDTERRSAHVMRQGVLFLGMGVSGGAEGARHGPAIMAGGSPDLRDRVEPLLRSIVATADGSPCFGWFGSGGAGHYVKMVHNGIEYAVMQAVAEVCHTLHYAAGLSWTQIADCLSAAEQGYLIEITREILQTADDLTDGQLIDYIDDRAGQKGTGGWCVADALDLGVAIPSIAQAVAARQQSSAPRQRTTRPAATDQVPQLAEHAAAAVDATTAIAMAQGLELALTASAHRGWQVTVAEMATAWRSGSILRMPMLSELQQLAPQASATDVPAPLSERFLRHSPALRAFAAGAIRAAQPAPVLTASLSWLDSLDLQTLPTAIVQAQRDRFGAHGYRRTDRDGTFHGPWNRTGA